MTESRKWQFWIDRGGTFTDIVGLDPSGEVRTHKLLSENPGHYDDAAITGMSHLMGTASLPASRPASLPAGLPAGLPADEIDSIKMGTTVATNALLERQGARTLFVTTLGHADVLRIAWQNRPRLFDLDVQLPDMLFEQVIEADERINAGGHVTRPLDIDQLAPPLKAARANGIDSVAIVLMHAWTNAAHEEAIATLCVEIGFTQISTSYATSPLMKIVGRGDTTVADAYLSPILRHYVDRVATRTGDARLMFMQSNGGLAAADSFKGKDAVLSGPAGGVVGVVKTAASAGFDKIIGFDMGGTSTDVCHYDGALERVYDSMVAGTRIRAPMMHIHTVAAGGGSVLHYDGGRFRVGPDSAGANPGPKSYGRDGPLCVTDCNVLLGRLQPDTFPQIFGDSGTDPLAVAPVKTAFATIATEAGYQSAEQAAEGFLMIAVENMARAIKKISLERGYDVSAYTLGCFGGAGGQHACMVADNLGIEQIIVHPLAGILSAVGIGLAEARHMVERTIEQPLNWDSFTAMAAAFLEMEPGARRVVARGVHKIETEARVLLRYDGTDTAIPVTFDRGDTMRAEFETAHRQRFGFIYADKPLIVEAITLEAIGFMPEPRLDMADTADGFGTEAREIQMYADGQWHQTFLYDRNMLVPGDHIDGPAIIAEPHGTNVLEPGWQATMNDGRDLVLRRTIPLPETTAMGTTADPVRLEIFNNLFMSIAEQMGVVIENTAHSVNMKERLDFSCALFDSAGDLIANAPHIPVHLGSMGATIQTVMRENPAMREGDTYVLNAPYNGGTHLPDITVVTPVFLGGAPLFYVGTRGHHADVGGISPGSVPPNSTNINQEGILFDDIKLVQNGVFQTDSIRAILTEGPLPARNPDQNIADLKAQVAANQKGVTELARMIDQFGADVVQAYMGHVQDNAEEAVRRVIGQLQDGAFTVTMDCGAVIQVAIEVDQSARTASVDFTGTSDQLDSNFNAPLSIARAAVLYVFRCLVDDDIPLNEGCLKPLDIIVPDGCFLNPHYPAAVVAGNVETSQCIVNALLGALGASAAAQGTMNNVTFGNDEHQYYETLAGGMGAGFGFDGASAIQTHMTNSRLTDPEVLEFRYPVTVEKFAIRNGSGGAGQWHGGDGVIRHLTFHEAMTASILSNNRDHAPFGLAGAGDGAKGINQLLRADGTMVDMAASDEVQVGAGDTLIIETPGGGGYGKPKTGESK
jgi:5-oxoprolinase (ATP-hydrolysing)